MDRVTARWLLNILCPAALIVTVYDLSQALNHLEHLAIASTLIMIGLVIGAWYVGLAHTWAPSTTGSGGKRPDRAVANDRR